MQLTQSQAILSGLAADGRTVLSEWRAVLLLRQATFATPESERRWSALPRSGDDIRSVLRQMQRRREVEPLEGLRGVYRVVVPYAALHPFDEGELLGEVNPYAARADLSALAFFGLTDQIPTAMYMLDASAARGELLPIGTIASDWEGVALPAGPTPARVLDRVTHWRGVSHRRVFGIHDYRHHGVLMRVTAPERTLLDALQFPDRAGGIANALRAWALARTMLDLDLLVSYVDRYDIMVLRQRVGFILEQLNLAHPVLAQWQANAKRGGTSRLAVSAPYASAFDERWSLSINTPIAALHGDGL